LDTFFLELEGARSSYCNLLNKEMTKREFTKKERNTERRGGIKRQKRGKNHENYK